MNPSLVPGPEYEDIHRLWDELSDFDLSQPDKAVHWLMQSLAGTGGMVNATWAGAVQMAGPHDNDALHGWRVAASAALHPMALQSDEGHLAGVMDAWDRRDIDPSFLLPLRGVGRFRTYSLRRNLPPPWFETPFYAKHYGAFGIYDLVLVAFPLNASCESHFGLYSTRPVLDDEIERFAYAMRGIKWFHRQLMLSHGLLIASSPLTPTESRVLRPLLTELPEKRIAQRLGLGEAATHSHVKAIYRKFNVRSRAGLISLWLGGPNGRPVGGNDADAAA